MSADERRVRNMHWTRYLLTERRKDGRNTSKTPLLGMRPNQVAELSMRKRSEALDLLVSIGFLDAVRGGLTPHGTVGGTFTDDELEAIHLSFERRFKTRNTTKEN